MGADILLLHQVALHCRYQESIVPFHLDISVIQSHKSKCLLTQPASIFILIIRWEPEPSLSFAEIQFLVRADGRSFLIFIVSFGWNALTRRSIPDIFAEDV